MVNNTRQKKKFYAGGFTLVEILVSLMIFTMVAVSSTGALLAIVDANGRAQSLKLVMDNLNVAVENMSRTMRIGTDYACYNPETDTESTDIGVCAAGTAGVAFTPQDAEDAADRVKYYFKDDNADGSGLIYRERKNEFDVLVETALTAPEVYITDLKFFVSGQDIADGGQPRVFMSINGIAGEIKANKKRFNIQTSVSQREVQEE